MCHLESEGSSPREVFPLHSDMNVTDRVGKDPVAKEGLFLLNGTKSSEFTHQKGLPSSTEGELTVHSACSELCAPDLPSHVIRTEIL